MIRSDISIDWESSPRILTVLAPSTEVTVQDLVDTCRWLEGGIDAWDDPALIVAAGKDPLGGGVYVGITATLQNALLAFEARPGPDFELCRVGGGNLVAVDVNNVALDSPIQPTAYVQVVIAASSSATLQELSVIQYASYDGAVHFDPLATGSGTVYPWGTPFQPVNDLQDAITIANERGFHNIHFMGDYTFQTGDVLDAFTLVGEGEGRTLLTIQPGAVITNCTITDARVTGQLDGGSAIKDCQVFDLMYVDGELHECMLQPGTITLGGPEAHFINCYSGVPGMSTPTIDCNGSGTKLGIRNYNGGVKLINKSGPEAVSIDLNSGQVVIDSTVTNGQIVVRGVGKLTNNATGTAQVISDNLLQRTITAAEVWDLATAGHTNTGSFGEAVVAAGSGGIAPSAIASAVWDASKTSYNATGSMGAQMNSITTAIDLAQTLLKYQKNRTRVDPNAYTLTIYDDDNLTPIKVFDLRNFAGLPSLTEVAERVPT